MVDRRRVFRRALLLAAIFAVQFVVIEASLRAWGAYAGASTFQELFFDDPDVGVRLRPGAELRYSTAEFTTDIRINEEGVRDDEPIGPKAPGERRIVILGDSLVLSVQVEHGQTFSQRLQARLNAEGRAPRWRVINAGVQGYGPVDEWLFFTRVASTFEPDIVMIVSFVGNDALEAADEADILRAGRPRPVAETRVVNWRRVLRSIVILQAVRVRLEQLRSRFSVGTPERPLATYLVDPPPDVTRGLDVTREAYGRIAEEARSAGAESVIVLMPARFQINDDDYRGLDAMVRQRGRAIDRQSASRRFDEALRPLGVPMLDLVPALASQPNPKGLFFQQNVHLTPRGHEVVAATLFDFLQSERMLDRIK